MLDMVIIAAGGKYFYSFTLYKYLEEFIKAEHIIKSEYYKYLIKFFKSVMVLEKLYR